MNNCLRVGILALGVLAVSGVVSGQDWLTSHSEAVALSKKSGKPILVDFTGSDWCGWCIKLKDEVFATDEFRAWAKSEVILLEVDFPRKKQLEAALKTQNEDLKKKYAIRGYPTILFLDAAGEVLGRSGYKKGGPEGWIADAKKQLEAAPGKTAGPAAGTWLTSYEEALALSAKTGKPILADFTGSDWCGWCIKLKQEVFDTDEFRAWSKDAVILLELDFPRNKPLSAELKAQNQKLAETHGVKGYPTILFLDGKGEKIGKSGYMKGGPDAWIKNAKDIIAKK